MSDTPIVRAVAQAWQEWQAEEDFPFTPDCCINGTRVAIRALAKLGVRASPVSVRFMMCNRFAWNLLQQKVPVSEWPHHAWSLGVGPDQVSGRNRWNGHLCAEGEGWTLDISAGQFERPGRIICRGPRVMPRHLPPAGERVVFEDGHGQRLIIERWPENNGWRTARGWLRLQEAEADELVRRTSLVLGKELDELAPPVGDG